MGALNPFAKNNGKPAPDAREVSNAEANANRITVIGADGTRNQEFGYISPNTGNFINKAPTPKSNVQAAMRLNESDAEEQARLSREAIGQAMLNRGEGLASDLSSRPTSFTEGLRYDMPDAQTSDPDAMRQVLYDQAMELIRPDMEMQERRTRSFLSDAGLPVGGEAYSNAMGDLNRGQAQTLSQIAGQATMQGADLAQRNLGNQMSLRQSQIGEREIEQNQYLNQIAAMLGGAPQFNRQTVAPSPINVGGNIYASYNAQEAARQAGMQNQQAGLGSMFQLGGTLGAAAISDIRMKTNIHKIGELQSGLPWYEFSYVWAPAERHQGVMAQEAMDYCPDAVIDLGGVLAVDYSRVS